MIPDGLIFSQTPYCSFSSFTETSTTYDHFKSVIGSKNKIGFGYEEFSFSYSKESTTARESIEKYEKSVSYSEATCWNYNLRFLKGKLSSWFVDEVAELPDVLTEENKQSFFEFFDNFGDHIFTRCNIGGLLR